MAPKTHIPHRLLRARDWQNRPEYLDVIRWWNSENQNVCSLIGIGGAGKTAIADRFLRLLYGATRPDESSIAEERSIRQPDFLFVFSFYDVPNAEQFFEHLVYGLSLKMPNALTIMPRYFEIKNSLMLMANQFERGLLIVLDGLELLQDDGLRGGTFGKILDGRLKDFLETIADGWMPKVRVLITTRFRLSAPFHVRHRGYCPIEVNKIEMNAAISLMHTRRNEGHRYPTGEGRRRSGSACTQCGFDGGLHRLFLCGRPFAFASRPSQRATIRGNE